MKANSSARYRAEKWWWAANVPAVIALYVFAPAAWKQVSILYLALVSIYALVLTADGNEEASRAKEHLEDT